MVIALPALAEILFWVGALIFCILCVQIAKALFGLAGGTLGKLPVVGGWINGQLHSVEHKIVGTMSGAAASVDAHIGAALHRLARVIDWMGREIRSHAGLIALLASLIVGTAPVELLRTLVGELRRIIAAAQHLSIHAVTRIVKVERVIRRSVAVDVLPRIRAAEREIGRVIGRDLPHLRAREAALERDFSHLGKWVRAHTLEAGTLAFAGAVAVALGRLNLGWLRCNSLGNIGRKIGCGGFGILEELLAASIVTFAALDICDFAAIAQSAALEFKPALFALVDVENALINCHGATRPPNLPIPRNSFPAVAGSLKLAA